MQNDFTKMLGMRLDDVAHMANVQPLMRDSITDLIDDRFHLQIPSYGIGFIASFDGRVSTIFFYSEGVDQYREFASELPEGITFRDSRSSVQVRLGKPDASGGGTVIQFLGKAPKWDRFDRQHYTLHIQYTDAEEAINLVSLIRPDSVPR